jgi:hypothetical protein
MSLRGYHEEHEAHEGHDLREVVTFMTLRDLHASQRSDMIAA